MQMLSSDISRLAETGHSALASVLVGAVLQWNNGVRLSSFRFGRYIESAVDRRGGIATGAESGHSALTGELIRTAL